MTHKRKTEDEWAQEIEQARAFEGHQKVQLQEAKGREKVTNKALLHALWEVRRAEDELQEASAKHAALIAARNRALGWQKYMEENGGAE